MRLRALLSPEGNSCHLCRARLFANEGVLCADCQRELNLCRLTPGDGAREGLSPLRMAFSAYRHEDAARQLLSGLKYGHDRFAALPLAHGMCLAYEEMLSYLPPPDAVIPVPVHASRLRERGYNQAEELARAFCGHTGLPLAKDALTRVLPGASQVSRTRGERLRAMEGAFQTVRPLTDRRVLLVDDVLTTGATAISCAKALLRAGAKQVALLTALRA